MMQDRKHKEKLKNLQNSSGMAWFVYRCFRAVSAGKLTQHNTKHNLEKF